MNWFRTKPHSVCKECRVHFEPTFGGRHPELCPTHRKPVVELEDRILLVCEWAKANWEKLEPDAKKWKEERNARYGALLQAVEGSSAFAQQQQSCAQFSVDGVGGIMGGIFK